MFFVGQVSGLVNDINSGIYSDIICGKCQTLYDGTTH